MPENDKLRQRIRRVRKHSQRYSKLALDREAIILDLIASRFRESEKAVQVAEFPSRYSPIEFRPGDSSLGTTVAFSSLLLQNGIVGPEFANFLSEGWGDTYFVKDFRRKWFQQGVFPLVQNRKESVELLRNLLTKAPRPIRFVGTSSGGFAALYFGAQLTADVIVAIAPQTNIDERIYARFHRSDPDDGLFDFDEPENDLRLVLANTPIQGQAFVVFGSEHEIDKTQAERLAEFRNVTLHPFPSAAHTLLTRQVIKSGVLENLLRSGTGTLARPTLPE